MKIIKRYSDICRDKIIVNTEKNMTEADCRNEDMDRQRCIPPPEIMDG